MSQQARVLTRKRRSAVIRSQPALAHVDPADLASMFALYARDHPLRSGACGDHDHAFVQWLSHAGYDMPSAPSRLRRILTGARRARP